jgi:hypothetical protein
MRKIRKKNFFNLNVWNVYNFEILNSVFFYYISEMIIIVEFIYDFPMFG